VLEAAILGRASEHFDRKIFEAEVALREGRTTRIKDGKDAVDDLLALMRVVGLGSGYLV
jgi:hypothetical protein